MIASKDAVREKVCNISQAKLSYFTEIGQDSVRVAVAEVEQRIAAAAESEADK